MTKHAKHHTHRVPEKKTAKNVFKLVLLILALAAGFIATVSRERLPVALQNQKAVLFAYALRDRVLKKAPAPEEKKAPVQKGYAEKDRQELEKLIDKGAKD